MQKLWNLSFISILCKSENSSQKLSRLRFATVRTKVFPAISTNFDSNFQSSIFGEISLFQKNKWIWQSDLRRQAGDQMMIGSSPAVTKMCFRISLQLLYILITVYPVKLVELSFPTLTFQGRLTFESCQNYNRKYEKKMKKMANFCRVRLSFEGD